jgi:hypothetical protein
VKAAKFATCVIFKSGERLFLFNDQGDPMITRPSSDGYQQVSGVKVVQPPWAGWAAPLSGSILPSPKAACSFVTNKKLFASIY